MWLLVQTVVVFVTECQTPGQWRGLRKVNAAVIQMVEQLHKEPFAVTCGGTEITGTSQPEAICINTST